MLVLFFFVLPKAMSSIQIFAEGVSEQTASSGSDNQPTAKELEQARQQKLIAQADRTKLGQELSLGEYSAPRTVVLNAKLLASLNKETRKAENAEGTFVQYTKNPSPDLPEDPFDNDPKDQAAPDVIVDASNGLAVALSKNYDNNRGLTCFTTGDPRELAKNGLFNKISDAVWRKSLDQYYTHKEVPLIPNNYICYTQEG
jgi:hypothetical protein